MKAILATLTFVLLIPLSLAAQTPETPPPTAHATVQVCFDSLTEKAWRPNDFKKAEEHAEVLLGKMHIGVTWLDCRTSLGEKEIQLTILDVHPSEDAPHDGRYHIGFSDKDSPRVAVYHDLTQILAQKAKVGPEKALGGAIFGVLAMKLGKEKEINWNDADLQALAQGLILGVGNEVTAQAATQPQ